MRFVLVYFLASLIGIASSTGFSNALKLTYQADHTLKDDEITDAYNKILDNLAKRVKAELRA